MAAKTTHPSRTAEFDRLPRSAHVDVHVTAAICGCSIATVWRLSRNGKLPKPRKIGPGSTRWNVGAIRDHLGLGGVA